MGHGNKLERKSSNLTFEWTKFKFSKNRNKFESLCSNFELSIKRASDVSPFHLVPRGPHGAAYVPILLNEVEQEERPSGNRDREAIVVGAGLCDGEGEHAYTGYVPHLGRWSSQDLVWRMFSLHRICPMWKFELAVSKLLHSNFLH